MRMARWQDRPRAYLDNAWSGVISDKYLDCEFRRVHRREVEFPPPVLPDKFREGRFKPLLDSGEALAKRLDDGSVVLLDVRPEDEFAAGHLPGALNIPFADLERRLAELPKDTEIVAYCRGPYCVLSFEAVAALRAKGYDIKRLEEGFPEWKAAGLPVGVTTDNRLP